MILPILEFKPIYRNTIWGGTRISDLKGGALKVNGIGESLELSPLEDACSVVITESLKGYSLNKLMMLYAKEILGETLFAKYGKHFPLLIKLIDATDNLSIQVHPSDEEVRKGSNKPRGKNEAWYIIDTEENADIILGLAQDTPPHELVDYAISGRLTDFSHHVTPHKGDIFNVPAGTIHAIGKGTLLLEVQQPSETTYRLWDYDRVDKEGRSRALHLNEALEVANLSQSTLRAVPYRSLPNSITLMLSTPHFVMENIWIKSEIRDYAPPFKESCAILTAVDGECIIEDAHKQVLTLTKGTSVLVPSTNMPLSFKAMKEANLVSTSLPAPTQP